jgi:hypothetical protein
MRVALRTLDHGFSHSRGEDTDELLFTLPG